MTPIKKIICCCGNGLGSSMIIQMTIEAYLRKNGRNDIEVSHMSISDANSRSNDLYVVGLDIEHQIKSFGRVIVLKDLVSEDELALKLSRALAMEDNQFFIK